MKNIFNSIQWRKDGSKQGTWPQALCSFLGPFIVLLIFRWILLEPFVIPSGSMIPELLINDHVFVKKFAYGIRVPFTSKWLFKWGEPRAGEIIVFRYPSNPSVFYIKRLVAGPGQTVRIQNGKIELDGQKWNLDPVINNSQHDGSNELNSKGENFLETDGDEFDYFNESITSNPNRSHIVRFRTEQEDTHEMTEWVVPQGHYFFMGDNRDQSSDSRVWGFVPEENLIGPAWFVWLSCDEMLESARFICNPAKIRWNRLFKKTN